MSFWELFCVNAFEELEPLLEARGGPAGPRGDGRDRCSTVTISGPGTPCSATTSSGWPATPGTWPWWSSCPTTARPWSPHPGLLPARRRHERVPGRPGHPVAGRQRRRRRHPRVLVSRHALVASSPADALRRATLPGRAGGYGHSFAFGTGSAMSIETSATRFAVNGLPGSHTNHYTDPELADRAPPPSPGSQARLARLQALVEERSPATPAAIGEILADHGGGAPDDLRARHRGPGRRGVGDRLLDDLRPGPWTDVGGAGQPVRHRLRGGGPGRCGLRRDRCATSA